VKQNSRTPVFIHTTGHIVGMMKDSRRHGKRVIRAIYTIFRTVVSITHVLMTRTCSRTWPYVPRDTQNIHQQPHNMLLIWPWHILCQAFNQQLSLTLFQWSISCLPSKYLPVDHTTTEVHEQSDNMNALGTATMEWTLITSAVSDWQVFSPSHLEPKMVSMYIIAADIRKLKSTVQSLKYVISTLLQIHQAPTFMR